MSANDLLNLRLPELKKDTINRDPDFEEKDQNLTSIPMDRKKFLEHEEVFGRQPTQQHSKGRKEDDKGNQLLLFEIETAGGVLGYNFLEKVVREGIGQNETPTLWRRGFRLWASMIYFAKKGREGLKGSFTASELLSLWGDPDKRKAGRAFEDVRKTFYSLVGVNPIWTNNRSGKDRREWGVPFTNKFWIEGEGRETRYHYELNPEALGITETWLKSDNMTVEIIQSKGGYLPYPVAFLKDNIPETEQNFRDRLLHYVGGYEIQAITILRDWCKLGTDKLRRRKYCYDLLRTYLDNAKTRGEITSYDFKVRTIKDWQKSWKLVIYKPQKGVAEQEARKGNRPTTQNETQLIESITEWLTRPINRGKIVKSDEQIKKQVTNTVKKYGVEEIADIYEETGNGAKPSTYMFWQRVKQLKSYKNGLS